MFKQEGADDTKSYFANNNVSNDFNESPSKAVLYNDKLKRIANRNEIGKSFKVRCCNILC